MSAIDPEPQPSWASPIALGAVTSFAGTMLLQLVAMIAAVAELVSCCCVAPVSFVPFGVLPALFALRRDPRLTPGQGFTIAFIGVGLGMVLWAGVTAYSIEPAEIADGAREAYEELQRSGGRELTEEQIDQLAQAAGKVARFVPAIAAAIVTVLAGLAGMVSISIVRRRVDGPPTHGGIPTG